MNKIILCLIVLIHSTVFAGTMHCLGGYAAEGDTKYEVIRSCGSPFSKRIISTETKTVRTEYGFVSKEFVYEQWLYDMEDGVIHVLVFENDVLISVEFENQ